MKQDTTIQDAFTAWYNDPILFVAQVFGAEPQKWQADVLTQIADPKNQRIAMCASKGPGKSCLLAWVVWWYLATRPESQIACTSVTADNLKSCLWKELSLWFSKSDILRQMFVMTKTEIFSKEEKFRLHWKAEARTWSKDADSNQQSETLAGLHGEHLLFVCDEVGAYPQSIITTAEAALSSGMDNKIVMAGNPTHNEGPLYSATTAHAHLWQVTHINGDPEDLNRSPRISKEWAQEQIELYGRDDPWVRVNVLGKFPHTSLNALLGPSEVAEAMQRSPQNYSYSQCRIGVDVARFGDDATCIVVRQGLKCHPIRTLRSARTEDIVGQVLLLKREYSAEVEFIDGTGGFGAGVVDGLIRAGASPMEIHFASKPVDERYANRRSEMWIELSKWVKRGGALPNDKQLARELTSVQYSVQPNGKMAIEPKEGLKKRLGFSPDRADAIALTFSLPESTSQLQADGTYIIGKPRVDSDWNPLSIRPRIR